MNIPLLYSKERLHFFQFKGKVPTDQELQLMVPQGMKLSTYYSTAEMADSVKRTLFPKPFSVLRLRMRRGLAEVTTLTKSNEVVAFGWIQSWEPFRRYFGQIASSGTMIGPAWTAPAWRGRRLHVVMLKSRIFMNSSKEPLFTFASDENHASMRGIERAGFRRVCVIDLFRFGYAFKLTRVLRRY